MTAAPPVPDFKIKQQMMAGIARLMKKSHTMVQVKENEEGLLDLI